jgi:c-di-GMP-binding flagellar brake protein YcgR
MNQESTQFLADGVARHAGLVLSVPNERGGLAHFKSRFLSQDAEGVWVLLPDDVATINDAVAQNRQVGVTYKAGETRRVFATTLVRTQSDCLTPDGRRIGRVLLALPSEIKAIQRRGEYRVRLVPENKLTLNCWIIPRHADLKIRPMPSQRIKLEVHDISMGGAGITLIGADGKPPTLTRDDRLRVEIRLDEIEMLVEGRLRMPDTTPSNTLRTGLRFFFFDDGLDERLKRSQLTKIIGRLQIQQVKAVRKQADEQNFPLAAEAPVPATISA